MLRSHLREYPDHIVGGKAARGRFVETSADDGRQFRIAAPGPLRRQRGFARDKRTHAAPGFQNARALEIDVHAGDRIGIDRQFDGELPDGRKLVSGPELSGRDCGADLLLELCMQWRRMARVDGEEAGHEI
jgi:hypothetical protein